jgi:GNAT superfamily N-acetyltransferase
MVVRQEVSRAAVVPWARVLIRPALISDVRALHAFASRLALDHAPDPRAHARQLREALADERSLVLIAEHDGVPIGSLVAGLLPMPMYGGRLAFLQELYVDEAVRGSGAGRALVDAFDAWARERGAAVEALGTSRPPAMAFYERLGFVTRPTTYYWRHVTNAMPAEP